MSSTAENYDNPRISKRLPEIAALYKPFVIGLLIVCGATYCLCLIRSSNGSADVYKVMDVFMGCFFVVFAIPKFSNLVAFAKAFRQYDLISKRFPAYAYVFPFIELCLGLMLLSDLPTSSMLANRVISVLVMSISGVGVISILQALRQKRNLDCACMGAAFKFPLSRIAIVENGSMFLMALAMLVLMKPGHMIMAVLLHYQGSA